MGSLYLFCVVYYYMSACHVYDLVYSRLAMYALSAFVAVALIRRFLSFIRSIVIMHQVKKVTEQSSTDKFIWEFEEGGNLLNSLIILGEYQLYGLNRYLAEEYVLGTKEPVEGVVPEFEMEMIKRDHTLLGHWSFVARL